MSYIGIPPFGQTVRTVTAVTATSGQTTFNISGGYVVGYVDVFLNGVLLAPADFTATDGLTVALGTGAALNDQFHALAYQPTSFVDTYTQTQVDGFLASKQDSLSSGTNIKTVNGSSLLGSGNLSIASGVTSVSGSAPISSSGGSTPAISIAQATSSADGYLSSTDWSTFNGKQAALVSGTNIKTVNGTSLLGSGDVATGTVTSVTGSAPISSSGGATPAISISQASGSTDGYLSSTDWSTFNGKGSGTVTSVTAGTGLSGGTITGSGTINLANTAVTAGSYTNANITVDAQGRITSASNGSGGGSTTYQAVGTYMFAGFASGSTTGLAAGSTIGGGSIAPAGVGGFASSATNGGTNDGTFYFAGSSSTTNCKKGATMSGTWQSMGASANPVASNYCMHTLYIRIA